MLKNFISIHAPLTGSDGLARKVYCAFWNFNPRSPHRERHGKFYINNKLQRFQSTLPSQGATNRTHDCAKEHGNFNPRSPHRERRRPRQPRAWVPLISIHAPLTGSDYTLILRFFIIVQFQSTLPSQGATTCRRESLACSIFQSTLPSQGATDAENYTILDFIISIHAPLTGSDATYTTRLRDYVISIHAPLTGSDKVTRPL